MRKVNNHSPDNRPHQEEDEIDIKEIFAVILYYKKSILFSMLIMTLLAGYHAYFSPSLYQAQSLLKISRQVQNYGGLINTAMYPELNDAENELIIFKSQTIARNTLKSLNIGTRYYTTEGLRSIELYKDSPFVVVSEFITPELYGTQFHLTPIDENKFRLSIKVPPVTKFIDRFKAMFLPSDKKQEYIEYDKVHHYSQKIDAGWFLLSVQKIYQPNNQPYHFTIVPNSTMGSFIQDGISASTTTKMGDIVALSFTDTVPLRAQEIVNAVVQSYINENLAYKSQSSQKQLAFIDIQLEAIDKALKGSAEKLQEYKATNIVVDLSAKATMAATKLSQLESTLYELNMQIDVTENIFNRVRGQNSNSIENIDIDFAQNISPTVNTLLQELQVAVTNYATLSVNYTKEHPGLLVAKRKILSLKNSLKEGLESNLRTLKNQKIGLLDIIEREKETLKSFPEQEQQLAQLTRRFMVNEKVYSFLLEKRAETAIEESSILPNTRIIDLAEIPENSFKPNRQLILLVGLILGFIVGVAQAFLRAYLDNTVKTPEDIEHLTHIPLYGAIPLIKSNKWTPYYQEAIRGLWINLAFLKTESNSKLISITSSISGEGKSFTIYHLSKMIAKNGDKSVIVLDLDMRRASLNKYFGLDSTSSGMSTLLADKCTLEEAILETEYSNLNIITSGPKTLNPTGLILSITLESIIEKLSQKYDYIFLDTPPIGLVSDATKIMLLSDLTLFVLQADVSTKEHIKEINQLNKKEEINLGIVFNGIDYGKKYGYDYKMDYLNDYLTK